MRTLQEALRDGWTYAGKMDFYVPYDMWQVHVVKAQGHVLVGGIAFAPKDFEKDA